MEHPVQPSRHGRFARRAALVLALAALAFLAATLAGGGRDGAFASSRQWLTVETPHFYIHFHPGYEKIAAQAAAIAEDVHSTVSRELGYSPKDRTHLTLTDTSDMANGFTDSSYYRKVQIYLVYPDSSSAYVAGFDTRAESWLRLVITHEYTHSLHLDMNDGLARAIRTVFGNVPVLGGPNITASYPFIEGLAVYSETAHTSGGRGQSAYYDMFLRAAALGRRLPRVDQVLGFYDLDGWWPAGTPYLYGWSLMDFIVRQYGEDKLAAIAREYSKLYRLGIGGAVKKDLGKTLFALWDEWRADLVSRYTAQADRLKAAPGGLTQAKNLTTDGELRDNLAFSPDGRCLAFAASGKKHFPGLYLLDLATGKESKLVSGYVPYSNGLGWFPDGGRLTYAKVDNPDPTKTASDLYLYDLRTGDETQLTHGLRADGPAVSPDGTKLAFVAKGKEDGMETRLVVVDLSASVGSASTTATAIADKSKSAVLWAPGNETQLETPAWSPDGSHIALGVWRKGGFQDIAVVDVETRAISYLTQDRATDRRPAWSPDGKYVVFESDRSGVPNLFAYELETGHVRQLTNALYGAAGPALTGRAAGSGVAGVAAAAGSTAAGSAPSQAEMAFLNYGPNGYDIAVLPFAPAGRPEVALVREDIPASDASGDETTVASAKTGDEALAAAGLKARPYNPWPSLAPRFWLPSISLNERGWEFGAITAGADAVSERSYSADVRFSPAAIRPAYNFVYQQTLPSALAPTLSLELSDQTVPAAATDINTGDAVLVWDRAEAQAVSVVLPLPKMFSGQSLTGGIVRQQSVVYGTTGRVYAGWDYSKAGGSGPRSWSVALGADARLLLRQPSLTQVTYRGLAGTAWGQLTLGAANERGRRNSFTIEGAAGASTLSSGISIGGQESPFGIRGYSADAAGGSRAVKLGIQYTAALAGIDRGYGDWPIFLGKLRASAFAEEAAAWDQTTLPSLDGSSLLASVGAEVTVDTYLGYIAPLRLGIGVAKPLTAPGMAAYPVLAASF